MTEQFTTLFNQFLKEVYQIVTTDHKMMIYQFMVLFRVKDSNDTMKFFFDQCVPYHNAVISLDDKYIHKLKVEFPFLSAYDTFDKESQECTLKYIQQLYLIAYSQLNKSFIMSSKNNSVLQNA